MNRPLTLFIVLFSINIHSQFSETKFLYANAGVSVGNYIGLNGGLNYIANEKFSLQLNYAFKSIDSEELPGDFIGGGIFGSSALKDDYHSISVLAGYILKLNASGTIRLNLQGGIGYLKSKSLTNFQPAGPGIFTSNYSFDEESNNNAEVVINPKIEFPFTRVYGLSISPFISMNSRKFFFGVSLDNIAGILRNKTN